MVRNRRPSAAFNSLSEMLLPVSAGLWVTVQGLDQATDWSVIFLSPMLRPKHGRNGDPSLVLRFQQGLYVRPYGVRLRGGVAW
eukprot:7944648-Karenia_brevis.AAC.1